MSPIPAKPTETEPTETAPRVDSKTGEYLGPVDIDEPETPAATASELREALAESGTGESRLAVLDDLISATPNLSAADAVAAVVGGEYPQFGPVTIAKMNRLAGLAD